jgi:hypothetical protein
MVNRCGGLTGLIAGKPAPTGFRLFIGLMATEVFHGAYKPAPTGFSGAQWIDVHRRLCGSWLASDGVGTANILGN